MVGQQARGESFEIVEVEARGVVLVFETLVFEESLAEQAMDGREARGKLFIQREAGFFGEEFEMIIVNVAQAAHRDTDGFEVVPITLLSLRGDGFAEGGQIDKNIIPILRGASGLDFIPTREDGLAHQLEFVFGRGLGGERGDKRGERLEAFGVHQVKLRESFGEMFGERGFDGGTQLRGRVRAAVRFVPGYQWAWGTPLELRMRQLFRRLYFFIGMV